MTLTERTFALLQRAFEADPAAMARLVDNRVAFDPGLSSVEDPLVVGGTAQAPTLGVLGVVNGVLELAGETQRVAGVYDERQELVGFRYDPE